MSGNVGKKGFVDNIECTEEWNDLQSQIKYNKCSNMKQTGAELCQAQVKLGLAKLYLINNKLRLSYLC